MAFERDPAAEELLVKATSGNNFKGLIGLSMVSAGNGHAEVMIERRQELTQHHGYLHGGLIATLADISMAWAAATSVGDVVTQSMTIQYLAPAVGDDLRARGEVIKAGKTSVSVQSRVYSGEKDGQPRLVATGLATIAALAGR
ncbi:MAG: PaaI family thioesterase [Pseudomonadota bacterium]